MDIENKITALGLTLPTPAIPLAHYVPAIITGNLLMISGQGPVATDGTSIKGLLGKDVSVEQGRNAAQLAALNILAQAKHACHDDLSKLKRCLKLGGFVACTADFTDMPSVINGASDLIVEVMGEAGKHIRYAVGAPSLPLGWAVEIEAIFELDETA